MANVTVSLSDSVERKVRDLASSRYGGKKGSMAKVIEDAVEKLSTEKSALNAVERQIEWMKKGFLMGKINFKHRSELYD